LIFKKPSGFSLIEVVVTMVIGSILFLIIGSLLAGMVRPYTKGETDIEAISEYRYSYRVINKELRLAQTNINIIGVNRIDFDNTAGNNIRIQENTAIIDGTPVQVIEVVRPSGTEVILWDLQSVTITKIYDWRNYLQGIEFTIVTEKFIGGQSYTYTNNFMVNLRNVVEGIT
jgi:prepilin-type N-terminal cleavage/methylation domain-containing protein